MDLEYLDRSVLESNRKRVILFEEEFGMELHNLGELKEDIVNNEFLRKEWLTSVCCVGKFSSDLLKKRLQLIKIKMEIYHTEVSMNTIYIAGFEESVQLKTLNESTKVHTFSPENDAKRDAILAKITADGRDDLKAVYKSSISLCAQAAALCEKLSSQVESFVQERKRFYEAQSLETKEKLEKYVLSLDQSKIASKENHRLITADYLVIRHNARMIEELFSRRKAEYEKRHTEHKHCLDIMNRDFEAEKDKMYEKNRSELTALTALVRKKLIIMETKYEDDRETVMTEKKEKKKVFDQTKHVIKLYEKKFDDLQEQRKSETRSILASLSSLKEILRNVEHCEVWHDAADPSRGNQHAKNQGSQVGKKDLVMLSKHLSQLYNLIQTKLPVTYSYG